MQLVKGGWGNSEGGGEGGKVEVSVGEKGGAGEERFIIKRGQRE